MSQGKLDPPHPEEIDWLAYAIGKIGGRGGIPAAAEELSVTRQTIYKWLDKGIGHLTFRQATELADRAGIPVELLRSRMGPAAPEMYADDND